MAILKLLLICVKKIHEHNFHSFQSLSLKPKEALVGREKSHMSSDPFLTDCSLQCRHCQERWQSYQRSFTAPHNNCTGSQTNWIDSSMDQLMVTKCLEDWGGKALHTNSCTTIKMANSHSGR